MATKTDEPNAETLKADIDALRTDFAKLRDHLAGYARANARSARETGEAAVDEFRHELDSLFDDLGRNARQSRSDIEDHVRDRPLSSLLVAFVAGMVISLVMGRRSG